MVRPAEITQPDMRITLDALRQRRAEARFANPRLPRDQHHVPLAGFRLLPAAQQEVELFIAPDERGSLGAKRLETTQHAALTDDTPSALRFGKPGERLLAEIVDLEQGADLPPRAVGDDQRVRRGQPLQPGGEIQRLADDPALLRRTGADQIAHHDEAAGDAEPNVQGLPRGEPSHRVDDREPGADSPLRVVLMRLGITEIDQHPVTHILRDKAGEAGHGVGDAAVIHADQLAQILGIEAPRQRCRAHQIAKHHGQLPPLGLAGSKRSLGRCRRCLNSPVPIDESGDRVKQAAAVADRRNAEIAQIVAGQPAQNLPVNVVVAERWRILFEPEVPQPFGHIH